MRDQNSAVINNKKLHERDLLLWLLSDAATQA